MDIMTIIIFLAVAITIAVLGYLIGHDKGVERGEAFADNAFDKLSEAVTNQKEGHETTKVHPIDLG